jgi:hypothetical protein
MTRSCYSKVPKSFIVYDDYFLNHKILADFYY